MTLHMGTFGTIIVRSLTIMLPETNQVILTSLAESLIELLIHLTKTYFICILNRRDIQKLKNLGFKQGLDLELGINEIFNYLKKGIV